MADLIDKKTVEKSHHNKLRDFYRNPKDCPVSPHVLNQHRDFIRVNSKDEPVAPERKKDIQLPRAAMAPVDMQNQERKYGPIFYQQYNSKPPRQRAEIINSLTDSKILMALHKRENAPTHKGLIVKRLKELGYEPFGDPTQGTTETR